MTKSSWHKDTDAPKRFAVELPSPIERHPLEDFLTEKRAWTFRQVLARRSTDLVVVVEDCYDPHNATAVIRTCDSYGIHRIHITTGRSSYKINRRVSQGAHRYVDVHMHETIAEAYAELRADGYRIMASDLHADAVVGPQKLREHMADDGRLAVVFGCEGFGLSEAASQGADGFFLIPMAGFSQSLNLSVSAASTLYALRGPELSEDAPGGMAADEQRYWFDRWLREQHPAVAREAEARGDYTPLTHPAVADVATVEGTGKRGEELDIYQQPSPDPL